MFARDHATKSKLAEGLAPRRTAIVSVGSKGSIWWNVADHTPRARLSLAGKFVSRAAFIGCVGPQDEESGQRLGQAFWKDWDRVRSFHLNGSPDDTCWFAGDGWWLSKAEP
jgi:protein-L-isoaspartate(D-aspartate) O-methyltransferase